MKRFSIKNLDKNKHFIRFNDYYLTNSGYNVIEFDKNSNINILGYLTFKQVLKLKLIKIYDNYGTKVYKIIDIKK